MANTRVELTGKIKLNSLDSKLPYFRSGVSKNGTDYQSFTMIVEQSKNNTAVIDVMDTKKSEIKCYNTDNESVTIDWLDQYDADVTKNLRKQHVISYTYHDELEDKDVTVREEFVTSWAFIDYLKEHSDIFADDRFTVTGRVNQNVYNGSISDRFSISNIYQASDKKKDRFRVYCDYYFTKDSFDFSDWKEEKKININGYSLEYIPSEKESKYVSRSIVLDCSKIDLSKESQVDKMIFKMELIGIDYNSGSPKVKSNIKSNKYYKMGISLAYYNGQEEVEFDESQLTSTQKMAIKFGMKTLDDFKPKGQIYGNRVTVYKLVDYAIDQIEFADGMVTLDDKPSDFEENIFVPVKNETVSEVEEKASTKKEVVEEDDDDEDLFD